jgi:hypothetical protein
VFRFNERRIYTQQIRVHPYILHEYEHISCRTFGIRILPKFRGHQYIVCGICIEFSSAIDKRIDRNILQNIELTETRGEM